LARPAHPHRGVIHAFNGRRRTGPLATPVTVNLGNRRGIFQNREPSALTDLIRGRGKFWLTFRNEPDGHRVTSPNSIIVLSRPDAKTTRPAHRSSVPQRATRDSHVLVLKNQLFIYNGTWSAGDGRLPREKYDFNQDLG
jgi:hypothetical protein